MANLSEVFKGKKQLNIGYIVGGYPNKEYTIDFLHKAHKALDILEIGIPYSDPIADGKSIAAASFMASEAGITTDDIFDLLIKERENIKIPMVFLVYFNLVFSYGVDEFIKRAKAANIKGMIIPDLPFEEADEVVKKLNQNGLAFIPLLSVTSKDRTNKIVSQGNGGFIYMIGSLGVTGTKQVPTDRLKDFVAATRKETDLPIAIGFGIKNNEDIRKLNGMADGLIVGTTIVNYTKDLSVDETILKIEELFRVD